MTSEWVPSMHKHLGDPMINILKIFFKKKGRHLGEKAKDPQVIYHYIRAVSHDLTTQMSNNSDGA